MSELTTPVTHPAFDTRAHGQRSMMRQFPTGVAVVTTIDRTSAPRGMTITSLCSVSLDPPTLLVCLRDGSPTLRAVADHGRFAVNLLHDGAGPVAELFASGDPDRFDQVRWSYDTGLETAGPHLFHDSTAVADCVAVRTEQAGDHVVVFGETQRVTAYGNGAPLLYGRREYRSWAAC